MDIFLRVFLPHGLYRDRYGMACAMQRVRKIGRLLRYVSRCRQQGIGACAGCMGIMGLLRVWCTVAGGRLILRHVNGLQAGGRAKNDGGEPLLPGSGGFKIRHEPGRQRGGCQQGKQRQAAAYMAKDICHATFIPGCAGKKRGLSDHSRARQISYSIIPEETARLSDSVPPGMGILTVASHRAVRESLIPACSLPMARIRGRV